MNNVNKAFLLIDRHTLISRIIKKISNNNLPIAINANEHLDKFSKFGLEIIKDKFSSPRKTKIIDAVLNYNIEETIQKESVVISITNQGYIKRSPLSS